jgi:type II secretory pathway pseudopilin PulG
MFRSNNPKARKTRSSSGQQLVEVIVAVAMSGFLAVIMGASLAQLMATSTQSENQLKAQDVAQEMLERIRSTPYSLLAQELNSGQLTSGQPYTVPMYSNDGVTATLPFQNSPLLCDFSQYTWSNASSNNTFRGPSPNGNAMATVQLQPFSSNGAHNALLVTITITWSETNQTVNRQYVLTSVITGDGIHT